MPSSPRISLNLYLHLQLSLFCLLEQILSNLCAEFDQVNCAAFRLRAQVSWGRNGRN
jgi:hypothetical protein